MAAVMDDKAFSTSESLEVDERDTHLENKVKLLCIIDSTRQGLTLLALLSSITILGVSASSIAVFNATHLPADFLLPLWPDNFNLQPTVALVVGSAVVVATNTVSLLFSRVQFVRPYYAHTPADLPGLNQAHFRRILTDTLFYCSSANGASGMF
jgi:hypothetical protein